MVPFIATVSAQDDPDARPVEVYRVIVLAQHREAAETAVHAHVARTHGGARHTFEFAKAWASPAYLKAARLKPGEVRRYEP